MFKKIVAVEPIKVLPEAEERIRALAEETVFYRDMPADDAETIRRIGGADCVLVSYTCPVGAQVLRACPDIRYIGMYCSLYSPESANVDIAEAERRGIAVTGVRDYGDPGVREYVISELARFLHGFGGVRWQEDPLEFTGLPVGVLGMGTTGTMVAEALVHFGADVRYYSRTRKPDVEQRAGIRYQPLDDLLRGAQIVVTCLTRGAILLGEREFGLLGDSRLLMNISIGPGHDVAALRAWLDRDCTPGNYAFADTPAGIDPDGGLLGHPHVFVSKQTAGMSTLTRRRLADKALANMERFLAAQAGGGSR